MELEVTAGQHLPQPCAQGRDAPPRRSMLREGSVSDAAVEEAERHLSDYLSRSAASSRPATPSIYASSADAAMRSCHAPERDRSTARGFFEREAPQPGILQAIPNASELEIPAYEHVFVYPAGTAVSKSPFETRARPDLRVHEARDQSPAEVGSQALSSYLNNIHEAVDRHDTDLRSLWRDFLPRRDPSRIDPWELEQTVRSRACSHPSRPAQDAFRHETSELESGRAALLQRCQDTQHCESANMAAASLAFCALEAEKLRAEASSKNLLAITASEQQCASDVEARALAAQNQLLLLAQECSDVELQAVEPVLSTNRSGEQLHAETRECLAEVSELEVRESSLQEEVASAEQHAQETERKALGLLRDLWEASQSLAVKRSEYTSQLHLRRELELSRQEEGVLAQRGLVRSADFCEPRPTQDLAVQEALQAAWETEMLQHHQAAEELHLLKESWEATRRSLIPVFSTMRQWQSDLGPCQRETPNVDGAVELGTLCRCLQACALESHRRQRAVSPGSADMVSSLSASPQRDSAALF